MFECDSSHQQLKPRFATIECEASMTSMTSRDNDSVTMTLSPLGIHEEEEGTNFEYASMTTYLGTLGLPLHALPECDSLTSMTSDLSFSIFSMIDSPRP